MPTDPLIERFLEAWLAARQVIQSANFNRFQKAGLSASQFMTLNQIPAAAPGMTLSELARRLNLGTATLTRTVDTLEVRGLLTRTKDAADRRQTNLRVTRRGRTLQNAASKEFHKHMAQIFAALTSRQQAGLVDGLEALAAAEASRGLRRAGPRATRSLPRSPRP